MRFDDYISNPMGRKNAVMSNREMYRNMYAEKLDKILIRENGKIDYTLYTDKDRYLIHFKIPSEVVPNFYYDTVVEFVPNGPKSMATTIKDYDVKFYSNDPSFVYTFAHAFIKNDIFIRDLLPRMSKEAVRKVATEKNPSNEVGYVKSIYFAYILMVRNSLFDKLKFKAFGQKYNRKRLLENITHAEEKIESRKKAEADLNKGKREKNKHDKEIREKDRKTLMGDNVVTHTPTISKTKVVGSVSRTNTVGKVNKIKR